jgi:hypothetical protein
MEKSNDKKRKAQPRKDDSNALAPKKSCLIHGPDSSHTTNKCQTMCEQAYWMKEAYKNISQAEDLIRNANVNNRRKGTK